MPSSARKSSTVCFFIIVLICHLCSRNVCQSCHLAYTAFGEITSLNHTKKAVFHTIFTQSDSDVPDRLTGRGDIRLEGQCETLHVCRYLIGQRTFERHTCLDFSIWRRTGIAVNRFGVLLAG